MNPLIPCPFTYGDIPGGGVPAVIVVAQTAPTVTQNQQQPGTFWLVPEPGSGNLYFLAGFVGGVPQWELLSSGSGSVVAVNGTTNQVTVNTAGGIATVSLPASIIAPGSLATTTTLAAGTALSSGTTITAGTSITATLGNITATNGNLVLSTAGNKLVINAATPAASSVGTTDQMTGGNVTITSSAITASSQIIYSRRAATGGQGEVAISAQAGGSATLTSSDNTETSTFDYLIIN